MKFSKYIDHTLLKQNATIDQIENLCDEAIKNDFKSVCVNPTWVKTASEKLKGTNVEVCTVIGFPLGASTTQTKAFETKNAIQNGATEIDMVINIGQLKNKNYDFVYEDIKAVVEAASDKIVKVIIETCLLNENEKIKACELCVKASATFVKTSTGFSTGGATLEDIILIKKTVGDNALIKASGGIKTHEDFIKMIECGASRIGTSSGVLLINGEDSTTNY